MILYILITTPFFPNAILHSRFPLPLVTTSLVYICDSGSFLFTSQYRCIF